MYTWNKFHFSISLFLRNVCTRLFNVDERIFMHGNEFKPEERDRFLDAFHDIILFTYRNKFKNICLTKSIAFTPKEVRSGSNNITSDIGWGCMYRVTQMSIANGINQFLKKNINNFNVESIINNFQDNEDSKFSIHNMVSFGLSEFGIEPKSWIGPTTSSMIASKLINSNKYIINGISISSIAYVEGTIYRNQAEKHFSEMSSDSCTFVWICMKLGISKFDVESYKKTIISISNVPQFICIMGGSGYSSGALLVVAFSDTYLYCLDPHIKVLTMFSNENYNRDDFVQKIPTKIYWDELDTSISMVFICRNLEDFDNMCIELTRINPNLFEVINNFDIKPSSRMEFDSGFLIL